MINHHHPTLSSKKVLTLSPSYEPIGAISWERAVSLLFSDKIYVLERYSNIRVSSPSTTLDLPSVVVFKHGHRKLKRSIRFSRNNVWLRDEGRCQYCLTDIGISDFTIDHVVPKTRGGKSTWENVVVSCYSCNQEKGEKPLQECRLKLHKQPCKPSYLPFTTDVQSMYSDASKVPDEWKFYLGVLDDDGEDDTESDT